MRRVLLSLAFLTLPLSAQAQTLVHEGSVPLESRRPAFATSGVETMPQMSIDERSLQAYRFDTYTLPPKIWSEMKACAAAHDFDVSKAGAPPQVMVVPAARTIKVHDLTVDSLNYADDSSYVGEEWFTTVAYSLVRSGVIVIVEADRQNVYTLRHEALHFILWRSAQELNHDPQLYYPCDYNYEKP